MGSSQKTENKARKACVEAGTQRYSVGMDTPRLLATSLGGTPLASSFLADSILLSVIFGFRPPFRPGRHTQRQALACSDWEVVNWGLKATSGGHQSGPPANRPQPPALWVLQGPPHPIMVAVGFQGCPYPPPPPP